MLLSEKKALDLVLYNVGKQVTYSKRETTRWVNKFLTKGIVRIVNEDKIIIDFSKKEALEGNVKEVLSLGTDFPFCYYIREVVYRGKGPEEVERIIIAKELEMIRIHMQEDIINLKEGLLEDLTVIYQWKLLPFKIGYIYHTGSTEYVSTVCMINNEIPKNKPFFIDFDIYEVHEENEEIYYTSSTRAAEIHYTHKTKDKNKAKIMRNSKELEIGQEYINLETKEKWIYKEGEKLKEGEQFLIGPKIL